MTVMNPLRLTDPHLSNAMSKGLGLKGSFSPAFFGPDLPRNQLNNMNLT